MLQHFLSEPSIYMRDLNGDATLFTAMIAVRRTHKVKTIYGMGMGTGQNRQVSPVANKILALFGKGGADLGRSHVLVL